MVYQRKALGVDITTVWRIVQQFQHTGTVTKRQYNRDNLPRKVNHAIELVALHIVLEHPGIYLREIQCKIEYLTGSNLSLSTICHLLHEQNFSRTKMRMVARQRAMQQRWYCIVQRCSFSLMRLGVIGAMP